MTSRSIEESFKVVATRCGSCGCGCPTVLETGNPDELVIVGRLDAQILETKSVKKHIGEDEIAVVIPRSLLLEAAKNLA